MLVLAPWGLVTLVRKPNFQAVIKSAASAASPKTKIQESRGASGQRLGMRTAVPAIGAPGFLDFGLRGGFSSRRLDHSLKAQLVIPTC